MNLSDRQLWGYLEIAWQLRSDLPAGAAGLLEQLMEEVRGDTQRGVHPDWISIREDLIDWAQKWGIPGPLDRGEATP